MEGGVLVVVKISLFIVHSKIKHGNVSLFCTLCNI